MNKKNSTNFGLWTHIIIPLTIIIITLGLIVYVLSMNPDGSFNDPNKVINSAISVLGSSGIFFLGIGVILYYSRNSIVNFFLMMMNGLNILNKCNYCTPLREDLTAYVVNGCCSSCGIHICSKCFRFSNKTSKKSIGCPECGSKSFTPRNRLGYYLFIPLRIKMVSRKIVDKIQALI